MTNEIIEQSQHFDANKMNESHLELLHDYDEILIYANMIDHETLMIVYDMLLHMHITPIDG
jgi:hypothetical protein